MLIRITSRISIWLSRKVFFTHTIELIHHTKCKTFARFRWRWLFRAHIVNIFLSRISFLYAICGHLFHHIFFIAASLLVEIYISELKSGKLEHYLHLLKLVKAQLRWHRQHKKYISFWTTEIIKHFEFGSRFKSRLHNDWLWRILFIFKFLFKKNRHHFEATYHNFDKNIQSNVDFVERYGTCIVLMWNIHLLLFLSSTAGYN